MQTGEDLQGLRKVIDFTRLISVFILSIHIYYRCYQAFAAWGWTAIVVDHILSNIAETGLLNSLIKPKLFALLFLAVSLVGAKGKKDENITAKQAGIYMLAGMIIYLGSQWLLYLQWQIQTVTILYIAMTVTGYLLVMAGGTLLSRLINVKLRNSAF